MINVQFSEQEFSVEESVGETEIQLIITHPIDADTHFLLHALTYSQYDAEYTNLKAMYPNLEPYTLYDEYDQAECKCGIDKRR